jgi:hypothetical protein
MELGCHSRHMANAYGDIGNDGNYFGPLKDMYVDTNEIKTQGIQVVAGIALSQKMNRIAPRIYCVNPDGTNGNWQGVPDRNDSNYFGPLTDLYVDTNPVLAPPGWVVRGASLYQKMNRVAIRLWCTDRDGGNGRWVVGSQENDSNYFGPLVNLYTDTNLVQLQRSNLAYGAALWPKLNRIAVNLVV